MGLGEFEMVLNGFGWCNLDHSAVVVGTSGSHFRTSVFFLDIPTTRCTKLLMQPAPLEPLGGFLGSWKS